jgi:polymorphic toxin system nucleotidyltransferase-like protein
VGAEFLISDYARQLAHACADVSAVWLFGSRANGTARENSDWDLLVFGGEGAYDCLAASTHLHRLDVDCLVMLGSDEFSNAWGTRPKSGSLSGWAWKQGSGTIAQYTEVKPRGRGDDFNMVLTPRIWSREAHAI